jgi:hypothetical protein
MRLLYLFPILFLLNPITITIKDSETKETLVGVLNHKSKTYSNLDGKIVIKQPSVTLDLISYEKISVKNIKRDTTIYMKPL